MHKYIKFLLVVFSVSCSLVFAETFRITTADGMGADAQVSAADREAEAGDADKNFGSEPLLQFKGSPNINYHVANYFRFDLRPLQGRKILKATLALTTADGDHFGIDHIILDHSSVSYHQSSFADIRIAKFFPELTQAENLLISTDFVAQASENKLVDGIDSGIGFSEPWKAEIIYSQISGTTPSVPGWVSKGKAVVLRGKARRPFAKKIIMEKGTIWIGGFLQSTNNARTTTVGFGDFSIQVRKGKPLTLSGIDADVASLDGMNFFLVRLDFDPDGNRLWLWSNPDLTLGEPEIASANASLVKVWQNGNIDVSLYGLKPGVMAGLRPGAEGAEGLKQLGADWPEDQLTWNNAPGGFVTQLGERSATGEAFHLYSLNLNMVREGLVASVSSPKLVWYLNKMSPDSATLILQGRDDRKLPFASKEYLTLAAPTLILEVE